MVPEESPTPKSAEGYTSAIALIFKKELAEIRGATRP